MTLRLKEEWIGLISQIKWPYVIMLSVLHICSFYGLYLAIFFAKWETMVAYYILGINNVFI